ncbi:MAG TPA: FecR domain-containing protein [Gemmatimonadaceae bacterium]|nr:FecR domain-containing protein [Gemmatimonadaceae bacterium]
MSWDAVARYLAGESPAEEEAAIQRWLGSNPRDAQTIAALDDALAGLMLRPEAERGIDVEAALARVKERRGEPLRTVRGGAPRIDRVSTFRPRQISWVPVAVAAAMVIAAGALVRRGQDGEVKSIETTIAARTLTTPVGGLDSLVLPDGSQVTLGPGSELTIAEGFGQSARRVSLRGEALFTVVHDDAKPFVVTANDTDIRDVGTAFVVRSDAGGVRVAVTEGTVELTRASGSAVRATLNAGDAATVTPGGAITAERGVGAGDDLAWTRGTLVFRDTPLLEVSEDLRRWYGVHLDIQDPALRRRPLSASFRGDSLSRVLEAISLALGATTERRGDTVVVRSLPR